MDEAGAVATVAPDMLEADIKSGTGKRRNSGQKFKVCLLTYFAEIPEIHGKCVTKFSSVFTFFVLIRHKPAGVTVARKFKLPYARATFHVLLLHRYSFLRPHSMRLSP